MLVPITAILFHLKVFLNFSELKYFQTWFIPLFKNLLKLEIIMGFESSKSKGENGQVYENT